MDLTSKKINEVMVKNVNAISVSDSLVAVVQQLTGKKHSCVIVVKDGKPVGIISERDIVEVVSRGGDCEGLDAESVMSSPVHCVPSDASLDEAVRLMQQKGFRRFPVVTGDGMLAGLVTQSDVIKAVARMQSEHAKELERLVEEKTGELATEKERLGVTLSSIAEGVIAVDKAQRIVLFNPVAEYLTGWRSEGVEQKRIDEVFSIVNEQTHEPVENPIDEVVRSGKTEKLADNTILIAEDGTERAIAASAAPIHLGDGTIIGIVLVFRDVTREREIDRMKTDFVSSVSHELRTPMTSIKGFTATILRDPNMSEETRNNFLEIINAETDRLSALIEDVLEVSRIESARIRLDRTPFAIEDVVDRTVLSLEPQMLGKGLQLRCETSENLPQLIGDGEKIQAVLVNLVNNAIKFTPEGGQITLRAFATDDCVAIQVEDTGMGIPEKDLSQIFERFYRVERPGMEIKGTGLGLPIVKEFVELHDGRIEVSSEEGKGSTFTVYLPLTSSQEEAGLHEEKERSEQEDDVDSERVSGKRHEHSGTA